MKNVNLEDFEKELGKLTDEQIRMLREITYDGLLRAIPMLVRESPFDTGQYASSWAVERPSQNQMSIGNFAPHAAILEYGARPFTPPIQPLLEWARRTLQEGPARDPDTGKSIKGPRTGKMDPDDYSPAVKALAYAVRAKIQREGMPPRHILENMLPKIVEQIIAEFKARGG